MRLVNKVALFGGIGLMLSLVIAGLSSIAPSVFGWLTAPFWLLSALVAVGAHDMANLPLFVVSGSLFYGVVAFLIYRWRSRRRSL